MKIDLQISDIDEPNGRGVAYSSIAMDTQDLSLPLDEFVERYLKPMFVDAKQKLESIESEVTWTESA